MDAGSLSFPHAVWLWPHPRKGLAMDGRSKSGTLCRPAQADIKPARLGNGCSSSRLHTFQTGALPRRTFRTCPAAAAAVAGPSTFAYRCKKGPPVTGFRDHRLYRRNFAGEKRESTRVRRDFWVSSRKLESCGVAHRKYTIFPDFVKSFGGISGKIQKNSVFFRFSSRFLRIPPAGGGGRGGSLGRSQIVYKIPGVPFAAASFW